MISNVTAGELAALLAARRANLPPPEAIRPRPRVGTLCRHAVDTGEPAFLALPCRGNRIECRKTGVTTYAAACRGGNCGYYARAGERENNQKV